MMTVLLWGDPVEGILHWAGDHWGYIAVALSLVVDISPIKWNPWKSLIGWIGKALTKDVRDELDGIKKDLALMKKEQTADEMDRIRSEVLDFANSCRLRRRHTKEEFDHIFALNDKYAGLLDETGQQNGRFEEAFGYIKELYRKCMAEDDFL